MTANGNGNTPVIASGKHWIHLIDYLNSKHRYKDVGRVIEYLSLHHLKQNPDSDQYRKYDEVSYRAAQESVARLLGIKNPYKLDNYHFHIDPESPWHYYLKAYATPDKFKDLHLIEKYLSLKKKSGISGGIKKGRNFYGELKAQAESTLKKIKRLLSDAFSIPGHFIDYIDHKIDPRSAEALLIAHLARQSDYESIMRLKEYDYHRTRYEEALAGGLDYHYADRYEELRREVIETYGAGTDFQKYLSGANKTELLQNILPEEVDDYERKLKDFKERAEKLKDHVEALTNNRQRKTEALRRAVKALRRRAEQAASFSNELEDVLAEIRRKGEIEKVISSKMPELRSNLQTLEELAETLAGRFKEYASKSISETIALYESAASLGQYLLDHPHTADSEKYYEAMDKALSAVKVFLEDPTRRNRLSLNDVNHSVSNHRHATTYGESSASHYEKAEAIIAGLTVQMPDFETHLYRIDQIQNLADPEYLLKTFEFKLSYLNVKYKYLDFSSEEISFYAEVLADLSTVARGYGNPAIDDRSKQYYHNTGDHSFTTIVTLMTIANSSRKQIERVYKYGTISGPEYQQQCKELKIQFRFLSRLAILHDLGEHFKELLGPNLKDETAVVESVLRRIRDIVEGHITENYALEEIKKILQDHCVQVPEDKLDEFVQKAKKIFGHISDIPGEENLFNNSYTVTLFDVFERLNTQTQLHAMHDTGKIGKDRKFRHGGHVHSEQVRYALGYFTRLLFGEPFRLITEDPSVIHEHSESQRRTEVERRIARDAGATSRKTGAHRELITGDTLEARPYTDRDLEKEVQERNVDFKSSIFRKLYENVVSLYAEVANGKLTYEEAVSRQSVLERVLGDVLEEGIHKVTKGIRIHPDYKAHATEVELAFRSKASQGIGLYKRKLERDGFKDLVDLLIRQSMESHLTLQQINYEVKDGTYKLLKEIIPVIFKREINDEKEIRKTIEKEAGKLKTHNVSSEDVSKICNEVIQKLHKFDKDTFDGGSQESKIYEAFKPRHLRQAPWIFGKSRRLIGFQLLGGLFYNRDEPNRYIAPVQPLIRTLNAMGRFTKEGISLAFKAAATPFNVIAYSMAKSLSPSDTANTLRKIGTAETALDAGITFQSGFSFSENKIYAMLMPLLSWTQHFKKKHREAIEKCYGHILLNHPEEIAEKYAPGQSEAIRLLMKSSSGLAKKESYTRRDADIFPSGIVSEKYYEDLTKRYSLRRRIRQINCELAKISINARNWREINNLKTELDQMSYELRTLETEGRDKGLYSAGLMDKEEKYYLARLIDQAEKKLLDRLATTFGDGKHEQRLQELAKLKKLKKTIKVNSFGRFIREQPLALRFAALTALGALFVSSSIGFSVPFTGVNILGAALMASGVTGLLMVGSQKFKDFSKTNMLVRFIEDIPYLEKYRDSFYSVEGHTARLGKDGRYSKGYEAFLERQLDEYKNMSQTRGNMNLGIFLAAAVKTGIMRIANSEGLKNAFNAQLVAGTLDALGALAVGIFLYHTLAVSPALVIAGGMMAFSYGLAVSVGNKLLNKAMEMQASGKTPTHANLIEQITDSYRYDDSLPEFFTFLLNLGNKLRSADYIGPPLKHLWETGSGPHVWRVTSRVEDFVADQTPRALQSVRARFWQKKTPSPG